MAVAIRSADEKAADSYVAKGNCDSRADYQKYEKEDDDLGNQWRLLHRT